MSLLATIVNEANSKTLPFLVIGGHAVNAHGFSRFTKDVDFLVRRENRREWEGMLAGLGFTAHRSEATFIQFAAPAASSQPLDLMLVNDTTFATMRNAAQEIDWNRVRVFVPALDHLFALKFHALQHGPRSRQYKDFLDILSLAKINGVDVRSDRMRQICDKYGTGEIYERLVAFSS